MSGIMAELFVLLFRSRNGCTELEETTHHTAYWPVIRWWCVCVRACVRAVSLMAGLTRTVTVLTPGDFSSTVQRLSTKY